MEYRVVHFVPDPFTGHRIPVAVIGGEMKGGRVSVVRGPHPHPSCLGSVARAHLLMQATELLSRATSLAELPAGLGPLFTFGPVQRVPAGDFERWAVQSFFPASANPTSEFTTVRARNRDRLGRGFLRAYKVEKYVSSHYRTAPDGKLPSAHGLEAVTHYVHGRARLLLMEPLVPERAKFEDDLAKVKTRVAAYAHAIEKDRAGDRATLVAYLLAGGSPQLRDRTRRDLASVAEVVDTTVSSQRARLIQRIKQLGEEAQPDRLL